jgi:hypothetical protein
MFATMALHPDVKWMAAITPISGRKLNEKTAKQFETLLTKTCLAETKAAMKYEGRARSSPASTCWYRRGARADVAPQRRRRQRGLREVPRDDAMKACSTRRRRGTPRGSDEFSAKTAEKAGVLEWTGVWTYDTGTHAHDVPTPRRPAGRLDDLDGQRPGHSGAVPG